MSSGVTKNINSNSIVFKVYVKYLMVTPHYIFRVITLKRQNGIKYIKPKQIQRVQRELATCFFIILKRLFSLTK